MRNFLIFFFLKENQLNFFRVKNQVYVSQPTKIKNKHTRGSLLSKGEAGINNLSYSDGVDML